MELPFALNNAKLFENYRGSIYADSEGIPTVGIGYSLVRQDRNGNLFVMSDADLEADGMPALSAADRERLEAIAAMGNGGSGSDAMKKEVNRAGFDLFVAESKADEVFEKSYQYYRSVVSNAVGEDRLGRLSAPQRALLVDAAFRRPRFVSDNAEELGSALDHAASTGDWSPVVSILSQLGQGPGQKGRSRDVALQIVPLAALGTHTLGWEKKSHQSLSITTS
jgi:hypothetical protein